MLGQLYLENIHLTEVKRAKGSKNVRWAKLGVLGELSTLILEHPTANKAGKILYNFKGSERFDGAKAHILRKPGQPKYSHFIIVLGKLKTTQSQDRLY